MNLDFLANPLVLLLLLVWTISWKGVALWRSARRNERGWFIALLLINTLGLLEIGYLVATRSRKPSEPRQPVSSPASGGNGFDPTVEI